MCVMWISTHRIRNISLKKKNQVLDLILKEHRMWNVHVYHKQIELIQSYEYDSICSYASVHLHPSILKIIGKKRLCLLVSK
jgi:hypothetical protein